MPERVLILGATSAIAHEVARVYARDGAALALAARDAEKLAANADDLRARSALSVVELPFDALDLGRQSDVVDEAWTKFGGLDVALVAWGSLPDPDAVQRDGPKAADVFDLNATSVIAMLTVLADRFEAQGSGTIGVISSVAGDRGRASNYVYGAAKAAVSTFAEGLRARLGPAVRVVTIKPGPVDTPMTAHLEGQPLLASPEAVGQRIHRALARGERVVYAPAVWRPIMATLRALPERLFERLGL